MAASLTVAIILASALPALAQVPEIRTGTNLGVQVPRLAVAEFKASGNDQRNSTLLKAFNDTLWSDLANSGVVEMVSKSFYPLETPSRPEELKLDAWGNPPANAGMVAFGNLGAADDDVTVQGWLYDAKNAQAPAVLAKQYRDKASDENARLFAHQFANEIIFRLGGGIQGITLSKIVYVSNRTGNKEIWMMDYDGNNQHQVTHLGSISLSPRISPDNSRVAFSELMRESWQIRMYSFDLARSVAFPSSPGMNMSPAWSPDGNRIAFSSSRSGDPEIYIVDSDGHNLKRVTAYHGPDVSPVWNPKTGAQIAWVSGQSGLPQIWIMEADGANPQRITDQGYAVSPSWSPNGQYLAFAWTRHYGPGLPGGQDIYVMDITTRKYWQLTHDAARNDFPTWSPDNRHIVFQSDRAGRWQIWTMLADGTDQKPLTFQGDNTQPNWSWK